MTKATKSVVHANIKANTEAYEREVFVSPCGFREYDARWLYPEQINLRGMQALGMGIGTIMQEQGLSSQKIAVGHDYRQYSAEIKHALIIGLMAAGCHVHDIGLCLSPTAYFAQFDLDCPAVAMVTASHNKNGWTGVKMGTERPLTFGPELMGRLKEIVLNNKTIAKDGGRYTAVDDMTARYLNDLTKDGKINRPLKAVVACGNGTAGIYAPEALEALGVEVVRMDCELDYNFPRYNPNPEDMEMLHKLSETVKATGADIGFGFDGDGDRCGVVDNTGTEIFADKVGVMLARDLATVHKNAQFVVDVKSTGLYASDPVLKELGAKTDYWKTGHSYIKRRVHELGALAGFEKSGHYFMAGSLGRGYDDGILSAILVCRMLDRQPEKSMSDLHMALPKTYSSPSMSPHCPDEKKYDIVKEVTAHFEKMQAAGETVLDMKIETIVTVNGVRFTLEDGTWGLVRASSNTPTLVVVVESPTSQKNLEGIFKVIEALLETFPDVGAYDQKLVMAA